MRVPAAWCCSSVAIRFLADFENVGPLEVAVVICLDLLRNALAESSLQGILTARIQHLLLDSCCVGAPAKYITKIISVVNLYKIND